MSRMISYLLLKTRKTHSKHHQNVNHYPRAPNIYKFTHKTSLFPWIGNKPSALLTTLPATLPNITKRTQIQASYDDFQMTSSGIHMYWCCTAASGLSRFSSLFALRAWSHHSRLHKQTHQSKPSVIIFSPPIPRHSPSAFAHLCRHTYFDLRFFEPPPFDPGLTAAESGCVRSTLPAWIRIRIARLKLYRNFTPVLFFSTVLLILSDRHSYYYYKPPTVLVKFFAYPVTSFYTYRV